MKWGAVASGAPHVTVAAGEGLRMPHAYLDSSTDDARKEYFRALGSRGGRATVERHGRAHMAAIGRVGFRSALQLGYGAYLAEYVFHVDLPATHQARPASAPATGACQWPGCETPAEHSHHVDTWSVSAAQVGLCAAHHTAFHREYRRAVKVWRGRGAERPTPRAVAIGLGIGLTGIEAIQ